MDTRRPEPEVVQSMRRRILEIDLQVAEMQREEYRKLLLSLVGEGAADAATSKSIRNSVPQRPQPRADPQPSSSTGDSDRLSLRPARPPTLVPAPSLTRTPTRPSARPSDSASARSERSIRAHRREVEAGELQSARPRPISRRSTWSPTLSRALSNRRSRVSGDTSGYASGSTISIRSTHENEVANDAPWPEFSNDVQALVSSLTSFPLSWGEQQRANETPKVTRSTLSKTFGGHVYTEWVKCHRTKDYTRFFCAKLTAQPFAPSSAGGRGLALLGPPWIDAQGDEEGVTMVHVFVATRAAKPESDTLMEYMGDYCVVSLPKNIGWHLLPPTCRETWLKRWYSLKSPVGLALRARIKLRSVLNREPSVTEVRERVQDKRYESKLSFRDISAAFEKGEENMRTVGIQCRGYNSHLATIISES